MGRIGATGSAGAVAGETSRTSAQMSDLERVRKEVWRLFQQFGVQRPGTEMKGAGSRVERVSDPHFFKLYPRIPCGF